MMQTEHTETERILYDPNCLLDAVLKKMRWEGDAALARKLNVHINVLQQIRCRTLPLGTSILMWMQEATGMSIKELRRLMGDRRTKLRLSYTCNGCLDPLMAPVRR